MEKEITPVERLEKCLDNLRQELEIERDRRRETEHKLTQALIKARETEKVATLRDQFAMAALAGSLAKTSYSPSTMAANAYEYADAMLEARNN